MALWLIKSIVLFQKLYQIWYCGTADYVSNLVICPDCKIREIDICTIHIILTLAPQRVVCNNPQTVFAPVLKNVQPRGKIAMGTFKFILSPILAKKNSNLPPPGGRVTRVSFQSWELV